MKQLTLFHMRYRFTIASIISLFNVVCPVSNVRINLSPGKIPFFSYSSIFLIVFCAYAASSIIPLCSQYISCLLLGDKKVKSGYITPYPPNSNGHSYFSSCTCSWRVYWIKAFFKRKQWRWLYCGNNNDCPCWQNAWISYLSSGDLRVLWAQEPHNNLQSGVFRLEHGAWRQTAWRRLW